MGAGGDRLGVVVRRSGDVVGYRDCQKCHMPAVDRWSREEPRQFGGRAHFNAHKQLADPKAKPFAAAIGLSDPAAPAGRCVACHATVMRNRVRSGVSCESCHGAASGWLELHAQQPYAASYEKSLPAGMTDLHLNDVGIAKLCVDCHVTPEAALARAGHPDGAGFDAGSELSRIAHWTGAFTPDGSEHASYDYARISGAAQPVAARARSARPAPAQARPAAPAAAAPRTIQQGRPATPAPPPWNWDEPMPRLPDDYPSDSGGAGTPPRAAPSIAEDLPLARDIVPTTEPAEPPGLLAMPPAAAQLAQLRGRGAALLTALLASAEPAPSLPPSAPPSEFRGPDGELLHLQDVIIYLALETLRRPE